MRDRKAPYSRNDPRRARIQQEFEDADPQPDHPAWRWAAALWAWDRGESDYLAILQERGPWHASLQPRLDSIRSGARKPRHAARFRVSAAVALEAACEIGVVLEVEEQRRATLGTWTTFQRQEPSQLVAESHARVRAAKERIAAGAGISVTTLEALEVECRQFLQELADEL